MGTIEHLNMGTWEHGNNWAVEQWSNWELPTPNVERRIWAFDL